MGNSVHNNTDTGFGASSIEGSRNGYTSVTKTGTSNLNFKVGGEYADLKIRDKNGNDILLNGLDSITGLATGNYNLFISDEKEVVAETGNFYRQKTTPTATNGTLWEDTSKFPIVIYKYNSTTSAWEVYSGIFLGSVYSNGTNITGVLSEPYNSGNCTLASNVKPASIIEEGTLSNGWYVLYSDGWFEQGATYTGSGTQTLGLAKNMRDVYYNVVASNGTTVGTKEKSQLTLTTPSSGGDCIISGYIGNNNITRRYYKYQDNRWYQPVYNGSNISTSLFNNSMFATTHSSIYDGTYNALYLFNQEYAGGGDDSGHYRIWESSDWGRNVNPWIKFTNPIPIKVSAIQFDFRVEWANRVPKAVNIYGMNTDGNYTWLASASFSQTRNLQTVNITNPRYFKGYYLYLNGSGSYGAYCVTEIANLNLTAYTQSIIGGTPTDYDYYIDTED